MSTPIVSAPSEEVAALHAQVRHYESELTERDTVIAEHQAVIAQRDAMIEHLQEQVRLLVARRFAPSSEKIPEGCNWDCSTKRKPPRPKSPRARLAPKSPPIGAGPRSAHRYPKRCRASTSSIGCPKMNAPARITAWSSSASARW